MEHMLEWFMLLLAADITSTVGKALVARIKWKKVFKKKRKARRSRRLAAVIPLRADKES